MTDLEQTFPEPLLRDLVEGRWLPVIGAGFSRNAITPPGTSMPLWDDLGRAISQELAPYPYAGPLDAISAYSHEYSRARLVERLEEFLHVDQSQPGRAHQAFCRIPFDLICTTNIEFLLETQYRLLHRYCTPMVEEAQLTINSRPRGVQLLKLHGDLHHPRRLVVTEEDYAGFLNRYPLIATYVSNLLITRTPVLIGYSLDDPDFRQLWQVITDRLGDTRRDAYAILVDARPHEIAKYARRGVRVISVPSEGREYGEALADTFKWLAQYWRGHVLEVSEVTEEDTRGELSLPADRTSRLCFFAVPYELQSLYRKYVFPMARRWGFVPLTADDVISPGDNIFAKIDALIARSHAMVVDATSELTLHELAVALNNRMSRRLLVVLEEGMPRSMDLRGVTRVERPREVSQWPEELLGALEAFFQRLGARAAPHFTQEPERLLRSGEYRAAVIAAITLLEARLRSMYLPSGEEISLSRKVPLGRLLQKGYAEDKVGPERMAQIREWMAIRNRAVHTTLPVDEATARAVVQGVLEIVTILGRDP